MTTPYLQRQKNIATQITYDGIAAIFVFYIAPGLGFVLDRFYLPLSGSSLLVGWFFSGLLVGWGLLWFSPPAGALFGLGFGALLLGYFLVPGFLFYALACWAAALIFSQFPRFIPALWLHLCCVHGRFLGVLEDLDTAASLGFSFGSAPAHFSFSFATGVTRFCTFLFSLAFILLGFQFCLSLFGFLCCLVLASSFPWSSWLACKYCAGSSNFFRPFAGHTLVFYWLDSGVFFGLLQASFWAFAGQSIWAFSGPSLGLSIGPFLQNFLGFFGPFSGPFIWAVLAGTLGFFFWAVYYLVGWGSFSFLAGFNFTALILFLGRLLWQRRT
ncbi:Hypothetical predicted protein [Olea europaea subsp. europaea]|uniref:Uncharacterized protein n=1 Tax=Olea europaea subsp. europaea TaxID=158383 RepID=A0A8S0SML4_OLEEU|nr:Hypothetical predicted protein [Olea europaea subsp. europaea]